MKHLNRTVALTLGGLLVAGCADGADDEMEMEMGEQPEAEAPVPDPAPPLDGAGAASAPLAVDSLAAGSPYLTDASGRALYLLEGEPSGESTCYDACAEEWPPYTVQDPSFPQDVRGDIRADLVGTLERNDGSTQLTYDGHALYYYHDDQGPGQTQGQDVTDAWGEWYLVTPAGEPLEEHGGSGS